MSESFSGSFSTVGQLLHNNAAHQSVRYPPNMSMEGSPVPLARAARSSPSEFLTPEQAGTPLDNKDRSPGLRTPPIAQGQSSGRPLWSGARSKVVDDLRMKAEELSVAGNAKAAVELYTYAIELAPDNALLYSLRSVTLLALNRFVDAQKDAHKVAQLQFLFPKERRAELDEYESFRKVAFSQYKRTIKRNLSGMVDILAALERSALQPVYTTWKECPQLVPKAMPPQRIEADSRSSSYRHISGASPWDSVEPLFPYNGRSRENSSRGLTNSTTPKTAAQARRNVFRPYAEELVDESAHGLGRGTPQWLGPSIGSPQPPSRMFVAMITAGCQIFKMTLESKRSEFKRFSFVRWKSNFNRIVQSEFYADQKHHFLRTSNALLGHVFRMYEARNERNGLDNGFRSLCRNAREKSNSRTYWCDPKSYESKLSLRTRLKASACLSLTLQLHRWSNRVRIGDVESAFRQMLRLVSDLRVVEVMETREVLQQLQQSHEELQLQMEEERITLENQVKFERERSDKLLRQHEVFESIDFAPRLNSVQKLNRESRDQSYSPVPKLNHEVSFSGSTDGVSSQPLMASVNSRLPASGLSQDATAIASDRTRQVGFVFSRELNPRASSPPPRPTLSAGLPQLGQRLLSPSSARTEPMHSRDSIASPHTGHMLQSSLSSSALLTADATGHTPSSRGKALSYSNLLKESIHEQNGFLSPTTHVSHTQPLPTAAGAVSTVGDAGLSLSTKAKGLQKLTSAFHRYGWNRYNLSAGFSRFKSSLCENLLREIIAVKIQLADCQNQMMDVQESERSLRNSIDLSPTRSQAQTPKTPHTPLNAFSTAETSELDRSPLGSIRTYLPFGSISPSSSLVPSFITVPTAAVHLPVASSAPQSVQAGPDSVVSVFDGLVRQSTGLGTPSSRPPAMPQEPTYPSDRIQRARFAPN